MYAVSIQCATSAYAHRRRHGEYFAALAESAELQLTGAEQPAWLDRLATEHDILRAALNWCRGADTWEVGLRIAGALGRFWWVRGHLQEGRHWLEAMIALSRPAADWAQGQAMTLEQVIRDVLESSG